MSAPIEAATPVPSCPVCGTPQRVFTQASWDASRPSLVLADCQTPVCDLFSVTLSLGDHALLTPEQIAGYARMNRERRISMAKLAARDAALRAKARA